jgi:hypothetical protein
MAAALVAIGCNGEPTDSDSDQRFRPTPAAILTVQSAGKDEDPSVVRAKDGSLHVAWFSDRTASGDIYITHAERGTEWAAPIRVTNDAGGDFNPNLIQDEGGVFHLTWFRWTAPFEGHIFYNHSADGVTWDPVNEVRVTTAAGVDDWVPTLVEAPGGRMLIIFASARRPESHGVTDLYVATREPGQDQWSEPRPFAGNSESEHDHLPLTARMGTRIGLVWVRHDTSEPLPWLNRKSDVYFAASPDGLTWDTPVQVTREQGSVVNLFPAFYQDAEERWMVNWLSTRSGDPLLYEVPVTSAGEYPAGVSRIADVGPGYSHRIVRTGSADVYLAVWVSGPEGSQDIAYRFFER